MCYLGVYGLQTKPIKQTKKISKNLEYSSPWRRGGWSDQVGTLGVYGPGTPQQVAGHEVFNLLSITILCVCVCVCVYIDKP